MVELLAIQDSLVLRARGSELLILPSHVAELKKLSQPREFIAYFLHEALVNRSARKLLEAWLRKDNSLWKRIHEKVQTIEISEETKETEAPDTPEIIPPAAEVKSEQIKGEVLVPEENLEKKSAAVKKPKSEAKPVKEKKVEKVKPSEIKSTAKKPTAEKKSAPKDSPSKTTTTKKAPSGKASASKKK